MKQVTVDTKTLIDTITTNRETHIVDYKDAHAKWADQATEYHRQQFESLTQNQHEVTNLEKPEEPQNYVDSYNVALKMLEMSVDESVTLSNQEFQQFVLDEWHWAHSFRSSVNSYTGKVFN